MDPDAELRAWVLSQYGAIGRAFGWFLPPLIFTRGVAVPNAASDGIVVLMNINWVRHIRASYCNDTACGTSLIVGVLVHELTHHVFQDALYPTAHPAQRRARERRADVNSGFYLAALRLDSSHLERMAGDPRQPCGLFYDCPTERAGAIRYGAIAGTYYTR